MCDVCMCRLGVVCRIQGASPSSEIRAKHNATNEVIYLHLLVGRANGIHAGGGHFKVDKCKQRNCTLLSCELIELRNSQKENKSVGLIN